MPRPESATPEEKVPNEWSIRDGEYDHQKFSLDAEYFAKNEEMARFMPDNARNRFLSAETVAYAFLACNQAAVLNNPKFSEDVHRTIAAAAMGLSDATQDSLEQMVRTTAAETLASVPIVQALKQIFKEGLVEDPQVQLRSLATVARLLTHDEMP